MKKIIFAMLLALLLIAVVGCAKNSEPMITPAITPTIAPTPAESENTSNSTESPPSAEPSPPEEQSSAMMIQITAGEDVITYQLNDSIAAKNLYAQLPLTLEAENYSNNEKIFYPPQPLDVSDAPTAEGGLGVLAYYAPWADVILFFDDFSPNGSLYELGYVVSGSEHIRNLSGTIEIRPEQQ